jgi:hypothetical protein
MAKTKTIELSRGEWEATLRNVRASKARHEKLVERVKRIEKRLAKMRRKQRNRAD